MPAKIKLEIEGTAWEIMEAFREFIGTPEEILGLKSTEPIPDREFEVIVNNVMEAETKTLRSDQRLAYCDHCGKVLTAKQIKQGNRYCSLRCSGIHNAPKSVRTRIKNKVLKAGTLKKIEALTGRSCMECGKELIKQQKKFCSRACSNRFHMKLRKGITTKWKPSVSLTAGQGITKGTALTA